MLAWSGRVQLHSHDPRSTGAPRLTTMALWNCPRNWSSPNIAHVSSCWFPGEQGQDRVLPRALPTS